MTRAPDIPRAVVVAGGLTLIEAGALFLVCAVYFERGLRGMPGDRPTALAGAAMGIGFALLLGLLGRLLGHGRRVALTPVLITQLLALPVAWGFRSAGQYAVAVLVALPALVVLVLLFGSAGSRDSFR